MTPAARDDACTTPLRKYWVVVLLLAISTGTMLIAGIFGFAAGYACGSIFNAAAWETRE